MRVAPLTADDVAAYRALMLEAYQLHPDAFTSTVAERSALLHSWWVSRATAANGASVVYGAFVGNELAGAAGIEFETREKTRHKANLFGMYVPQRFSGRGLGKALVLAILEHARSRPGTELVQLAVTEGNLRAQRIYESCGFTAFGVEPRALSDGNGYRAKVHMWCDLLRH